MEHLSDLETIEIDLLLEAIFRHSGYDFRQYARGSVSRNLQRELEQAKLKHISQLIPLVLNNDERMSSLLQSLSINVTDFFRDPNSYKAIVEHVFPVLRSFPFFKVWHAGCSNGKEVYSLAILLEEAGLLERSLIYATDFNHQVLDKARDGIYPKEDIDSISEDYRIAGGNRDIQDYFSSHYKLARIKPHIRKRITFAHHNLATDSVFGEMQLIVCRNVLIYFDQHLKAKVLNLFEDSLCNSGFLLLGATESVDQYRNKEAFMPICRKNRLYKKLISTGETVSTNRGLQYV